MLNLELLDSIGHLSCRNCTKYGCDKCPNFNPKHTIAKSVFSNETRYSKLLCKSFEFDKSSYPKGWELFQKTNLEEYIEYENIYWNNCKHDSKWKFVGYNIDEDYTAIYEVNYTDYYNNTLYDENGLKAVRKKTQNKRDIVYVGNRSFALYPVRLERI
jgi:hypothetical protein